MRFYSRLRNMQYRILTWNVESHIRVAELKENQKQRIDANNRINNICGWYIFSNKYLF